MKKLAPLLFLAALIASAPAIADARPDGDRGGEGRGGGWRGGGGQAERGGGRWGDGSGRWGGDRGGEGRGGWRGGGEGRGGEGRGSEGRGWGGGRANFSGDNGPERAPPARGPNSLREGYGPQQDEARRGVREGGFVPLPNVLNSLRRQRPGRQLDTGIEDFNGRPSYRVRWVDQNGQRMDFIVDARSGAVLSVEGR